VRVQSAMPFLLLASLTWGSTQEKADFPGSTRGSFLKQGMGARPVGMGEAFTAVADDAVAVSWNPAGIGRIHGLTAVTMYDVMGQGMGLGYAAGAMPLGPGVAGASVHYFNFGNYDIRDEAGVRTGGGSAADFAVSADYAVVNPAWLPFRGWSGLGIEFVSESVGGGLLGLNLGGIVPVTPDISVGLAALHVGPAKDGFSLPATIKAGGSYTMAKLGTGALDVGHEMATGLSWLAVGVEATPIPSAALRAGYRFNLADQGLAGLTGLTFGLGGRWKEFGLDYAFQPFGELAASHRISLVYGAPMNRAMGGDTVTAPDLGAMPPDQKAAAEYQESISLYNSASYDGALAKAESAVKLNPGLWQAWQLAGNCRYAKGDTAGAVSAFDQALLVNPDNPQLKTFVDQVRNTAPAAAPAAVDPDAEYQESLALYNAGNYDGALARSGAAVGANPAHWQAWQMVGNCRYAKGDVAGAVDAYNRSLAVNPDNPQLKAFVDSMGQK